jgi:hypothetical protein
MRESTSMKKRRGELRSSEGDNMSMKKRRAQEPVPEVRENTRMTGGP